MSVICRSLLLERRLRVNLVSCFGCIVNSVAGSSEIGFSILINRKSKVCKEPRVVVEIRVSSQRAAFSVFKGGELRGFRDDLDFRQIVQREDSTGAVEERERRKKVYCERQNKLASDRDKLISPRRGATETGGRRFVVVVRAVLSLLRMMKDGKVKNALRVGG